MRCFPGTCSRVRLVGVLGAPCGTHPKETAQAQHNVRASTERTVDDRRVLASPFCSRARLHLLTRMVLLALACGGLDGISEPKKPMPTSHRDSTAARTRAATKSAASTSREDGSKVEVRTPQSRPGTYSQLRCYPAECLVALPSPSSAAGTRSPMKSSVGESKEHRGCCDSA